jgi:hypothetical protein
LGGINGIFYGARTGLSVMNGSIMKTNRTEIEKGWEVSVMEGSGSFPKCRKCHDGVLIPLSDYGREGAPITYKAWVCSNPECGFNLRIDNGEISVGRTIGQSMK